MCHGHAWAAGPGHRPLSPDHSGPAVPGEGVGAVIWGMEVMGGFFWEMGSGFFSFLNNVLPETE